MRVEQSVEGGRATGRAEHQGPEVDGATIIGEARGVLAVGDLAWGRVTGTEGVDLIAEEERA